MLVARDKYESNKIILSCKAFVCIIRKQNTDHNDFTILRKLPLGPKLIKGSQFLVYTMRHKIVNKIWGKKEDDYF